MIEKLLPIPKKDNTTNGYVQGAWFAIILSIILSVIASLIFWILPFPRNIYTYLLTYAIIASVTIPFCFGNKFIRKIDPGHKGVPLVLEGRKSWFTYGEGLIWALPEPLMGYIPVNTLEREYEIDEVIALSSDLVPIIVDLVFRAIVVDPYASTCIDKLDEFAADLGMRETRAFVSTKESQELPTQKQELSGHIKENGNREMGEEEGKPSCGMKITRVLVKDIRLPKKLEDAYTQQKIDRALAIAKLIRIQNLKDGLASLKANELLKMSDQELVNAVQAEYGTADRIVVDGSDPFSRAAAIAMKKRNEGVAKNEE